MYSVIDACDGASPEYRSRVICMSLTRLCTSLFRHAPPRSVRSTCIRPNFDVQCSCNNSKTRLPSILQMCRPLVQTGHTVDSEASSTQIHKCTGRSSNEGCIHSAMSQPATLQGSRSSGYADTGFAPSGCASSQALQRSHRADANT